MSNRWKAVIVGSFILLAVGSMTGSFTKAGWRVKLVSGKLQGA